MAQAGGGKRLTRNVVPTSQSIEGTLMFSPALMSNMPPRHKSGFVDSWTMLRSSGSMAHALPPNERETFSCVPHAVGEVHQYGAGRLKNVRKRTVSVLAGKWCGKRLGAWYTIPEILDVGSRSSLMALASD